MARVTRYQLGVAVYGMRQAIELSELLGIRIRRDLRDVLQQLDDELVFVDEPASATTPEELIPDLMGTKAVADELGCTPQHVGRNARTIGGQLVEGRWVFRRQDVDEYKTWKGVA